MHCRKASNEKKRRDTGGADPHGRERRWAISWQNRRKKLDLKPPTRTRKTEKASMKIPTVIERRRKEKKGTRVALEDAGFTLEPVVVERGPKSYVIKEENSSNVGVILGVGSQNMDLCEKSFYRFVKSNGPGRVSPFALPHAQICAVAVNVTVKFGIKGGAFNVSTACASSNHAIIQAYKQILSGDEKVIVTGGADACITPFVFGGFVALNAMSTRNDEPRKASRPFDRDRDGFVMGEGAGIIILEELEHALERGAKIYCEMTGYGATSDAYHITVPDPGGEMQARAMQDALKRAGTAPEEIDYINAHGTSTALNDPVETTAIKNALGKHAYNVPISSTKSMAGHLIGGSGGIEAIATALMFERKKIHPTINLDHPAEGCDLDYVPNEAREKTITKAISNSFGFRGQNALHPFRKKIRNRAGRTMGRVPAATTTLCVRGLEPRC